MNIQKMLLLILKVILLLSVILIFSYVNTKKAHLEKMKKNEKNEKNKKNKKEGLATNDNKLTDENLTDVVDNLVNKTRANIENRIGHSGSNKSLMTKVLNTLNRNTEPIIEGMGGRTNEERDERLRQRKERRQQQLDKMSEQECKYEGKSVLNWVIWFFQTILFVFVWLGKGIYNLIDEKTRNKPRNFFSTLFAPFEWVFWIIGKILLAIWWVLKKLKYVVIFIIATIGNILFVFAPTFLIDIIAYILSPFVVLTRSISKMFGFSPLGAVCWQK